MASVLRERARRLATIAPVADNWFAWQAFARRYNVEQGPLPPYLEAKAFGLLKLGSIDCKWPMKTCGWS